MTQVIANDNIVLNIHLPSIIALKGDTQTLFANPAKHLGTLTQTQKGKFQFDLFEKDQSYLAVEQHEDMGVTFKETDDLLVIADTYPFLMYEPQFLNLLHAKNILQTHDRIALVSATNDFDVKTAVLAYYTKSDAGMNDLPYYILADSSVETVDFSQWDDARKEKQWLVAFKTEDKLLSVDSVSHELIESTRPFSLETQWRIAHTIAIDLGYVVIEPKELQYEVCDIQLKAKDCEDELPNTTYNYLNHNLKIKGVISIWGKQLSSSKVDKSDITLWESSCGKALLLTVFNIDTNGVVISENVQVIYLNTLNFNRGFISPIENEIRRLIREYIASKGFDHEAYLVGFKTLSDIKAENYNLIDEVPNVHILGKRVAEFKFKEKKLVINAFEKDGDIFYDMYSIDHTSSTVFNMRDGYASVIQKLSQQRMSKENRELLNDFIKSMIECRLFTTLQF